MGWQHVFPEQRPLKKLLHKTTITGLIPYLNDNVFRVASPPVSQPNLTQPDAGQVPWR